MELYSSKKKNTKNTDDKIRTLDFEVDNLRTNIKIEKTQKNIDDREIVTLDPCEEITLMKEESSLIVKLCPSGDQWKVTEQRLVTP